MHTMMWSPTQLGGGVKRNAFRISGCLAEFWEFSLKIFAVTQSCDSVNMSEGGSTLYVAARSHFRFGVRFRVHLI